MLYKRKKLEDTAIMQKLQEQEVKHPPVIKKPLSHLQKIDTTSLDASIAKMEAMIKQQTEILQKLVKTDENVHEEKPVLTKEQEIEDLKLKEVEEKK